MPGLSVPVAMLIGSAVSGGTSLLGAKLAGGKGSSTSTTQQQYDPATQALRQALSNQLMWSINRGPAVHKADRAAMRTGVNDSYNAIGKKLESLLTSRGFGESGKMGTGFKGLEIARLGDTQRGEQALQSRAQQEFMDVLRTAGAFTNPTGSTTTTTGTNPSQVGPAIAGIGGNLATALWLSSLLGGGGSSLPSGGVNYGGLPSWFRGIP